MARGGPSPFLLGSTRRVLFPSRGRNVPFTVANYAYVDQFGRETVTWSRTFKFPRCFRIFDATMIHSKERDTIVDYLGTHQHLAVDIDCSVHDDGSMCRKPTHHAPSPPPTEIWRAHSCRFPYGNLRDVPVGHAGWSTLIAVKDLERSGGPQGLRTSEDRRVWRSDDRHGQRRHPSATDGSARHRGTAWRERAAHSTTGARAADPVREVGPPAPLRPRRDRHVDRGGERPDPLGYSGSMRTSRHRRSPNPPARPQSCGCDSTSRDTSANGSSARSSRR